MRSMWIRPSKAEKWPSKREEEPSKAEIQAKKFKSNLGNGENQNLNYKRFNRANERFVSCKRQHSLSTQTATSVVREKDELSR